MRRMIPHIAAQCLGVALLWLLLGKAAMAGNSVVTMTSLEWPPYSGEQLDGQGMSAAIARAAFAAMGYELRVQYYPWKRAVALARTDPSVAGYFPEYFDPAIETSFYFSHAIGTSPLGLMEHVDAPVTWQSLEDLTGMTIGTVAGYVNTMDFDTLVKQGKINGDPVVDDASNMDKLARKRLKLAVIDCNVLHYLQMTRKKSGDAALQCNPKLLATRYLHLCFHKDARGEQLVRIFNEGLERIDLKAILDAGMARAFNTTPPKP